MMRSIRWAAAMAVGTLVLVMTAGPAVACGGLVAPNGTVRLGKTSTLAAYHDGVEHYVTAFEFSGQGEEVGSIVPLPDIPTKVERGGDWTLQRLERELPQRSALSAVGSSGEGASSADALVVYETKIDALDITILKGGAAEVGRWARKNGYLLPPDSPEILAFYAQRSPIFMAARFDATAARERGQESGDGTPIHLTIPTDNPWVPLRILTLGRAASEVASANVFVLTDAKPTFAPRRPEQLRAEISAAASDQLLDDLRSDKGMGWIPESMWLTAIDVSGSPELLNFDLAIDASGRGKPSAYDTGLYGAKPSPTTTAAPTTTTAVAPPTSIPAATAAEEVALIARPAGSSGSRAPLVLSGLSALALAGIGGAAWAASRRWARAG